MFTKAVAPLALPEVVPLTYGAGEVSSFPLLGVGVQGWKQRAGTGFILIRYLAGDILFPAP